MVPNILNLLKKAINERRCLALRYRDQGGVRVVEPHAAYTRESGEVVVDCYQTRGYSSSGRQPPFWKRFRIKKIAALSVLKDTFTPRVEEGFSSDKSKYKRDAVAIVDDGRPTYMYSPEALKEMGPFLPDDMRKYH
ncbi:MAG: WYL domain-containing protein [Acidiferrobacterales bacterium]